jgi:hypothetical protein
MGGHTDLFPLTSILSPAFAKAASRRQATGERKYLMNYFLIDL